MITMMPWIRKGEEQGITDVLIVYEVGLLLSVLSVMMNKQSKTVILQDHILLQMGE
jgi:hypothetical protein